MNNKENYPFNDSSLPLEERLADLMSRLTLDEKICLIPTEQGGVERLGILPYTIGMEGAHGFVDREGTSTTFPQTIGLACTWDRELLYSIGRVTGTEARVYYNRTHKAGLSLWFPTIDLERDPRWGRTEEGYGEDPYLTGELASEIIKGTQGDDPFYVLASCATKHFFANNTEKNRASGSNSVPLRSMYEYYLEPFRRVFKKAKPFSLMTSYNAVNGIPMMRNSLVKDLVRNKWGLEGRGHIVTDGGGVGSTVAAMHYFKDWTHAVAASMKGGADTMTDDPKKIAQAVKQALDDGLISEDELDAHVASTLRLRFRYGQFDKHGTCPYDSYDESSMMTKKSAELSRRTVRESVVLLKNEGLLPIRPSAAVKIAVVGPLASENFIDWYSGHSSYNVTPLQALKETYGHENVVFSEGCDIVSFTTGKGFPVVLSTDGTLTKGSVSDKPACFVRTDWGWGANTLRSVDTGKYLDMIDLYFDNHQVGADELTEEKKYGQKFRVAATAKTTSASYFATAQFNIVSASGASENIPEGMVPVYVRCWNGMTLSATGVESTETPELFYMRIEEDGVSAAVKTASAADAVFVFAGSNPMINGKEDNDRYSTNLPPAQSELLAAVGKAQPNTALVLISGYPYTLTDLERNVPAIVYAAHGLQEEGHGLADVLCGNESPAGRLPLTWYRDISQLPPIEDYDLMQHGRTYQYFTGDVLYPFGYGLSYSAFEYGDLQIDGKCDYRAIMLKKGSPVTVSFRVKNIGTVTADEVPQMYIGIGNSAVKRPFRTLRGFTRISLAPGEERTVTFTLSAEDTAFFDVIGRQPIIENAFCNIMVGASSEDIRLSGTIQIQGKEVPRIDPYREIPAQNYCCAEGCFLGERRGSNEPAVYAKQFCSVTYPAADFSRGASFLIAVVCTQQPAELELYVKNDDVWKRRAVCAIPNTGDICTVPFDRQVPLWITVRIPLETEISPGTYTVKLEMRGEAGIHSLYFE